jgi:hypothetical protein
MDGSRVGVAGRVLMVVFGEANASQSLLAFEEGQDSAAFFLPMVFAGRLGSLL